MEPDPEIVSITKGHLTRKERIDPQDSNNVAIRFFDNQSTEVLYIHTP